MGNRIQPIRIVVSAVLTSCTTSEDDDALQYLPAVDLPQPRHNKAHDRRQYGIAYRVLLGVGFVLLPRIRPGAYSFRRRCPSLSRRYSSSSAAARHFSWKISAAFCFSASSPSRGRLLLPPAYLA
jgi:hypothetical protein